MVASVELGDGEIRKAAHEQCDAAAHRFRGRGQVAEHLVHGARRRRTALLRERADSAQPGQQPDAPSEAIQPRPLREAREAVHRAEHAGTRQHAAEGERLSPGIAVLGMQLLACPADDVAGRHSRRTRGDAVVTGEAAGERPVLDVAQFELAFDRVPNQGDAPASRLPLDGIDDVRGTGRLAERALVAFARRLVDVRKEAWGRDGANGHWARIVDEIADPSIDAVV